MPTTQLGDLPEEDVLLTTSEAATLVKHSVGTLQNWRSNGNAGGPPYVKVGARVFYRRSDIRSWMASLAVHA